MVMYSFVRTEPFLDDNVYAVAVAKQEGLKELVRSARLHVHYLHLYFTFDYNNQFGTATATMRCEYTNGARGGIIVHRKFTVYQFIHCCRA